MLRNNRGWIMLDSLIGVIILSIALVALAGTYIMASKSNTSSKNYGQALAFAQQYTEDYKRVNNTNFTTVDPNTAFPDQTVTSATGVTFTAKSKILTVAALPSAIVPVQIAVSWTEPSGNKQISVVNYYYKQLN
jgi:type II secretory pathway pseudopilin PulG